MLRKQPMQKVESVKRKWFCNEYQYQESKAIIIKNFGNYPFFFALVPSQLQEILIKKKTLRLTAEIFANHIGQTKITD